MRVAEELRKHADLAIKEGGMYYSGEYLSGIATVAESLEAENAYLREQVRKLVPELCEQNAALCKENAKLRECLQDFADAIANDDGFGVDQGWMLDRMHELGIEVDA